MIQNYYSIYDTIAKNFKGIWPSVNDATAMRIFKNACEDKNTEIGLNPIDYKLYKAGTFDDETGDFKPEVSKIMDGRAAE